MYMEANKNTLFFLGFIIKRTDEGIIRISDTRYKDENGVSFKKIGETMVLLPNETIKPLKESERRIPITVSVYTHIAEAANAFFDKLNEV